MKLNVGFVNNGFQLGGAETVVKQLVHGSLKKGQSACLYVADGKYYPREDWLRPFYPRWLSRLAHSRFGVVTERLFPRYTWTDRKFRQLAHSTHDLIHIHNFHGIYASVESLAYLAHRKPVVWTFHRFWGITGGCDHPGDCTRYLQACGHCPRVNEWPISGFDNTAEKLALKLKHLTPAPIHIVAPSQHLARTVSASLVGKNWKVSCIPNGVDPKQFSSVRKHDAAFRAGLGLDPLATTILIVNRDFRDPLKGFNMVEKALHYTGASGLQLVFVGGNSDWAAQHCPAAFSTVALGYVDSRDRMAEIYEACEIFLYASPRENFPCVILEAMSAQCCVVSTPTDGVVEQVENGVSGLVADSFSPEDLARSLSFAVSQPERRMEYAAAGRRRVEKKFSEDMMLDRHLELYSDMLNSASTRGRSRSVVGVS
jgi:glycosyltransferase involved in cell wall biosynthesis